MSEDGKRIYNLPALQAGMRHFHRQAQIDKPFPIKMQGTGTKFHPCIFFGILFERIPIDT